GPYGALSSFPPRRSSELKRRSAAGFAGFLFDVFERRWLLLLRKRSAAYNAACKRKGCWHHHRCSHHCQVVSTSNCAAPDASSVRSEEHTSELQSRENLVC